MYRGCTRLEAVGLVCNFSGKLLTGAFLDKLSSFFYSRLAWRHLMTNFSRYIVIINIYALCCFSWRTEAVKILFSYSTGGEPKTVEEKKAVYQIRRPLGLAFVISFVGWENCCRSIFSWTLICSSLPQSPDLLGFPATYPPPPHIDCGPHLNLNHGGVSLTKLTCS